MFRPLFIDMSKVHAPKRGAVYVTDRTGALRMCSSSFRTVYLMAYGFSKARLCSPDNRPPLIPPHSPTNLNPLFYHIFIRLLQLVPPFHSLSSSTECLLHPIQDPCIPLMGLSLLPRVPIPISPRTSRQNVLSRRWRLSGVDSCVSKSYHLAYIFNLNP